MARSNVVSSDSRSRIRADFEGSILEEDSRADSSDYVRRVPFASINPHDARTGLPRASRLFANCRNCAGSRPRKRKSERERERERERETRRGYPALRDAETRDSVRLYYKTNVSDVSFSFTINKELVSLAPAATFFASIRNMRMFLDIPRE